MVQQAFSLLHPKIQEELYRMKWSKIRAFQAEAIHELVNGSDHLIISAKTAGGKTEAAFLPILSTMVDKYAGGIRALYVGPLKALINDQFRRLEELCDRADIPVHKWHGDVGQSARKSLLQDPSGVLLMTPESLEAMFINRPQALSRIFGQLAFVVIDEMHSFIGTERGAHLKSLLARVSRKSGIPVRIVGLSATLGDPDLARKWLNPTEPGRVRLVAGDGEKLIKYLIKGYLRTNGDSPRGSDPDTEGVENDYQTPLAIAEDIFSAFYAQTALIFANSRSELEYYADVLRRKVEREKLPNLFRVHHGSLSKAEREDTEQALRGDQPTATFCSSTLEMGIDVGNVKAIGQIGPPWSVNSLAQRLGRSGRRDGEASIMRMYIEANDPSLNSALPERLFPRLIQAMAMTELIFEKWCEPPEIDRLHLSTLTQQIMSVIAETGGASAATLYDCLIEKGAFVGIDKPVFVQVLRSMRAVDLIEQEPGGDIILGLEGEKIVRHHDFYSAFITPDELTVVHQGRTIGSIAFFPGMASDGYLILAGHRWKIRSIDLERKEILVEKSRGGRLPLFQGGNGADIHHVVRNKMRGILSGDLVPPYLDATAKAMLNAAREAAQKSGVLTNPWQQDGTTLWWFTWAGDRQNRTLVAIAMAAGLAVRDEGIALGFEGESLDVVLRTYRLALSSRLDPLGLAAAIPVKQAEKYETYLVPELQDLAFAARRLDVDGALEVIRNDLQRAHS